MTTKGAGSKTPSGLPGGLRRGRSRRSRHRYGPRPGQVADLWLPAGPAGHRPPVVVLLHGGYWRSLFTKRLMEPLARDVARRGWAAWNVEYRRVGLGGGGGGWPTTFDDVARAVDHLATIPAVDPSRVVICGHSAGGHLACWVAGRRNLAAGALGSATAGQRCRVGLRGVIPMAGVVDLAAAAAGGAGAAAVGRLLGPDPEGERLRAASPLELLPLGVPQLLVHGEQDTTVPPSMSRRYGREAAAAGDDVVVTVVPGEGHRDAIRPSSGSWTAVTAHAGRLLEAD